MEKNFNIKAAGDRDRTVYLDNDPHGIGAGNYLGGWNGTTNNQQSYLNAGNLREKLANTYLGAAATTVASRNNLTRLNAATSTLVSDINGWGENLREADTGLDAAGAIRNNPSRLDAATSTLLSDIHGWRETTREAADTGLDAAGAIRNNPASLNAATNTLVSDINEWRKTLRQADTALDAAATGPVYDINGWREALREADTGLDAVAAVGRNNPARLNAATSTLVSDINEWSTLVSNINGWRETLGDAATSLDAAAAIQNDRPTRSNAATSTLVSDVNEWSTLVSNINGWIETFGDAATSLDAATAIQNNRPTRLNAATRLVSDINGWREATREAATGLDAAAAIQNDRPTRMNAATSLVSDINGWKEAQREADTDLDVAAEIRSNSTRLNTCIRGLQIGGGETINREGRKFQYLMNDVDKQPFSNNLIESAVVYELPRIVAEIVAKPESLIKLSLNQHDVKSVRKLIKSLGKTSLLSHIITALCTGNGFYRLLTDSNGSSVIFTCLDVASSEQIKLLCEAAIIYCLELAKHERGCINLKEFITTCRGQGRQLLLDFIAQHSLYLSQDPTGNYILQHVIGLEDPTLTEMICSVLRGHYVQISLQKAGSHVVERCLKSSGMEIVLGELVKIDKIHELLQLARDRYGNYVVQTALTIAKRSHSTSYEDLLWLLKDNSKDLQSGYGRNVLKLIATIDPTN